MLVSPVLPGTLALAHGGRTLEFHPPSLAVPSIGTECQRPQPAHMQRLQSHKALLSAGSPLILPGRMPLGSWFHNCRSHLWGKGLALVTTACAWTSPVPGLCCQSWALTPSTPSSIRSLVSILGRWRQPCSATYVCRAENGT